MNVCPNCNTTILENDSLFCAGCGSPLTPPSVPPRRKKLWIIAGVAVCLVLLGILAWRLWYGGPVRAAKLVPEDTDIFVVVKPDPQQVKNFNHIKDIYLSIPEVREAVEEWEKDFRQEADLDFEADVKPWLGREAALAVPDLTVDEDPAVLLALETKDEAKTSACMRKMLARMEEDGYEFTTRVYQGTGVTVEENASNPFAYAITGDFLLVSNDEDLLCETIDRAKNNNKQNLANNEHYQEVMKRLPRGRALACYLDYQNLVQMARDEGSMGPVEWWLDRMEAYESIGYALSFVREGIRMDYVSTLNPEKSSSLPTAGADKLEETLVLTPEDSVAYIGTTVIPSYLRNLLADVHTEPGLSDVSEGLNEMESETGIDIEQDILGWMKGEMALAIIPDNTGLFGETDIPVGFVFMVEVNDSDFAARKVDKIANVFMQEEPITLDHQTISGSEVRWLRDASSTDATLGYCFDNNYLIMGSSEYLFRQTLSKGNPLAKSPTFKSAMKEVPSPETSCMYFDVKKGTELLRKSLDSYDRQEFDQEVYPYVKPIKSVAFSAQVDKDNAESGTLMVSVSE
ncbi:MAG: DUF3352 domain-containing protein [Syntrophothermus sp.]|uniref:DUF3352 domain-containing protein n=1 Tax=Syntrophothermus sp. TaxID=2736299 RepID=UPI00257BC34A|nr:DUF3352 domain-containing protein [Syntrophothermus sp.]NSW82456.1 DUF3352 domain-containing protein [Syntrophothermus sp.]